MARLLYALASLFIVAACGSGSSNPASPSPLDSPPPQRSRASLFKGVAATSTENPNLPAVAIHEHGDQLAVTTGLSGAGTAGTTLEATFRSMSGDSATVVLGPNGFPESARFDDVVVLFDNYTESTVDIAVVPPAGEAVISRAVPVDPALLSSLRSLSVRVSASGAAHSFRPAVTADDWLAVLKFASVGLKVASCAVSAASGAVPLAAYACSHAIVDVLYLMTDTEKPLLLESVGALGDTALCIAGIDVGSCVEAVITGATLAIELTQSTRRSRQGAVDRARDTLARPSPAPRPTPPPPPPRTSTYDGSWTGSGSGTSSGSTPARTNITFQVSGERITFNFDWTINQTPPAPSFGICPGQGRNISLTRQGNAFTFNGRDDVYVVTITGTFGSSSSVSGTATFQRVGSSFPVCPSATVSWSGRRQ